MQSGLMQSPGRGRGMQEIYRGKPDSNCLMNTWEKSNMECSDLQGWFRHLNSSLVPQFCHTQAHLRGFSGGSAVKNLPAMQESQETWVGSRGQ